MDREAARRFVAAHALARAREREAERCEGPRPAWAVAAALELVDLIEGSCPADARLVALREEEATGVRKTWAELRATMLRR